MRCLLSKGQKNGIGQIEAKIQSIDELINAINGSKSILNNALFISEFEKIAI